MDFADLYYKARIVLTAVAEAKQYSWNDKFARKYATEALDKFVENLKWEDVVNMTRDELYQLGFGNWDGGKLLLLPLYLYDLVPDGTTLYSISGRASVKGTDSIDMDTRFGCLAYGIHKV